MERSYLDPGFTKHFVATAGTKRTAACPLLSVQTGKEGQREWRERDVETEMRNHKRGPGSDKWQAGHNAFPCGDTFSYPVFVQSHTWHSASSFARFFLASTPGTSVYVICPCVAFIMLVVNGPHFLSSSLYPGRARGKRDGEERTRRGLPPVFRGWS